MVGVNGALKIDLLLIGMATVGLLYSLYALRRTRQGIFLSKNGADHPFTGTPRQIRLNERIQAGASVFILILSLLGLVFALSSLASTHGVVRTCVVRGMDDEHFSRGGSDWQLDTSCGSIVSYGSRRPDMLVGATYRMAVVESGSLFGSNEAVLDKYLRVA
jgi:hypothetical protein